jgi:hypothetical protein
MSESKYDYLMDSSIVRHAPGKEGYPPYLGMIYFALKNSEFNIRFTPVTVPFEGKEVPHKHDFDEVFLFVPFTADLEAYDAETWLYVGDEGQKMIITKTCAVHMPAGLMHCPIIHKRVGMPFFFVNCPSKKEYTAVINGKIENTSVPGFHPNFK